MPRRPPPLPKILFCTFHRQAVIYMYITEEKMAETQLPDYPRGITFEQVWAGLMETRKNIEDLGERMGYLSNRFGDLAEHLVAPGIEKRFNELGYHFRSIAPRGLKIIGQDGKTKTEIDILLENCETIIAVEVKASPRVKDIEHHIRRLEILREFRTSFNDSRKILGAIAGAIFGAEEKNAAIEAGLYVLEQSGDTMKIDMPEGFIPHEW